MNFAKMSGAGNDFVLLDWASKKISLPALKSLARRLCDRKAAIGADGLLVLSRGRKGRRLFYFNADGSQAFCGNGSRCAAWWLYRRGLTGKARAFSFQSSAGLLHARVTGPETVAILMPSPAAVRLGLKLKVLNKTLSVHAINTGVPHAVVPVSHLEDFPVFDFGRALRRHAAFSPAGANVNFMSVKSGRLTIRTYERGVEDETLACGTGAVASALVACLLKKSRSPVSVAVRGKARLTVSFSREKNGAFKNVWLEGPAQVIFEGRIPS